MERENQNISETIDAVAEQSPKEPTPDIDRNLEEIRIKKKRMQRQLLQSAMLTFTALVAVIIVAIAWFINNRQVQAHSAGIQGSDSVFELASEGTLGQYNFQNVSNGEETEGKYQTAGTNAVVEWMLNSDSNFSNLFTETDSNEKTMLRPGLYGSLTCYIIPKKTGPLSLHFSIETVAYSMAEGGSENIEAANGTTISVNPVTDEAMQKLIKGHILFFRNLSGGYYSNLVSSDGFDFSGDVIVGEPVTITLYWIWPIVFDKYFFAGRSVTTLCEPGGATYAALLNFVETSTDFFFYDPTGSQITFDPDTEYNANELNMYRRWYNMADEEIGTTISFIRLQLNAGIQ